VKKIHVNTEEKLHDMAFMAGSESRNVTRNNSIPTRKRFPHSKVGLNSKNNLNPFDSAWM
jgi:hypothetical protein